MQENDNVSIRISFEGSEREVDAAARALANTLKGATYLQRISVDTQASAAPEGTQGALVDLLRILAESGLVTSLLNLAMRWFKDHKKRNAMTFTIACNNNSTVITQTVRKDDDIAELLGRVKRDCLHS